MKHCNRSILVLYVLAVLLNCGSELQRHDVINIGGGGLQHYPSFCTEGLLSGNQSECLEFEDTRAQETVNSSFVVLLTVYGVIDQQHRGKVVLFGNKHRGGAALPTDPIPGCMGLGICGGWFPRFAKRC